MPTPDIIILGILPLIIWTLIIVTSVKYVIFAMSVDNDGEGGILALMALLGVKKHQRPAIVAAGLFGAGARRNIVDRGAFFARGRPAPSDG